MSFLWADKVRSSLWLQCAHLNCRTCSHQRQQLTPPSPSLGLCNRYASVAANITAVLRSPLLWATWHLLQVWEILYSGHYLKCVIFAAIPGASPWWGEELSCGNSAATACAFTCVTKPEVFCDCSFGKTCGALGCFSPQPLLPRVSIARCCQSVRAAPRNTPLHLCCIECCSLVGCWSVVHHALVSLAWGCLPPLSPACPALSPWPRWSHGTPVVPLYVPFH